MVHFLPKVTGIFLFKLISTKFWL